jgi:hypothetical protein
MVNDSASLHRLIKKNTIDSSQSLAISSVSGFKIVQEIKQGQATEMDGTLRHCIFENLKPVEISKNCFKII